MNDSAPDTNGVTASELAHADYATPIFRTVNTHKGRVALRLEAVFWDAIATMAHRASVKPTDMVRDLISRSSEEATNLSSALRSIVTRQLLVENDRLAPLASALSVVRLLQTVPTPSFALDKNKQLVRVNDEFVRYLRSVMAKAGAVERAQLRLERPADVLLTEIPAGSSIECGLSIHVDNHERRTQARIIIPPPAPANILVGFIIN
ncbi:ribbon-helix-helix domain-containing protein [Devosia sp. MC1541]|uniref:ribbon-helix-helix domain-containing protein n=1 Tax=Devosia sp. MC1541 TaxID=2725264 RepID=UPI00145CD4AC|nr:ribbon-helix-helix domain-containing protein [Devosia sp. MC1541]